MGVSFSCPLADYNDVEKNLESVVVKSICFGDEDVRTPVRSVSFNHHDSEPTIFKSLGSGKMTVETSVSFKGTELEKMVLVKALSLDKEKNMTNESISQNRKEMDIQSSRLDNPQALDPSSPKHMAALKLQKVYKSFRTRRKLADCAVLVEQSWWKLLDFAELKRSSISFFEIEKHETAISRWSRARTRAAKVGKGLSKNDKAQKLALQHWLEAIDPRHRYGHNLHFYYVKWLHCQSREPFFYWLDIGEGKEVNLVEKCPRSKLQQQCIKYLGPMERMAYEVVVEDGKFFYKQSGELLHTSEEGGNAKWIFVLSTSKILYVGKKKKGTFQHSSFLAGGATSAAGRLVVENGILKVVWPHSGHYRPTEENFKDFISFLQENNLDLTDVQMSPVDEEEGSISSKQRSSAHFRSHSSDEDLTQNLSGLDCEETNAEDSTQVKTDSMEQEPAAESEPNMSPRFRGLGKNLTNLEIPKRKELFERSESENQAGKLVCYSSPLESPVDGFETTEEETFTSDQERMSRTKSLPEQDHEEGSEVETIPEESILKRINSHKGMKSYQLGKHLSFRWTTGAGPRIGCVRDYPSELQFQALEQVNLSPRSAARSRLYFSPRIASGLSPKVSAPPTNCGGEMAASGKFSTPDEVNLSSSTSINPPRTQPSPLFKLETEPSITTTANSQD
ncbi:IQ domain-containing protein IQM2 [Ziziphus jujuba]|uniref:IQ domain-containing protein IQM2 n=1 Tax=Ziziphus jujuba TaxID=326968 RepID=A0A6P3ZJW1_ZIZJJ|nr:IQ domain-containing protein IQM2 [Ziziphus jujuba]